VAAWQIDRILKAMSWAPSAHNRQPLRIVLIDTREWKETLANAMGERLRADRLKDGDSPDAIEQDVQRSFARIAGAPLVLLLCADLTPMDQYSDSRRQDAEWLMASQSVAIAAQNALLAAHALDLGACWMCAPLFCPQTVTAALHVPEHWEPQILITIGHPANAGKPRSRHRLADIVWRPQYRP
jgi:F420 biosynthesis protein FbiB-like protein